MKKTALLFGLILTLTACGGNDETPNASQPSTTTMPTQSSQTAPVSNPDKKTEHYSVGTDANLPPFSFKDEKGQIIGFEIDVLQAIADDQNFSVELVSEEFNELFGHLSENKYQILMATLGIKPERLEKFEMSKPYVWASNIMMGRAGNKAQTLEEIGEGKLAVEDHSYSHETAKKVGVKHIEVYPSLYLAYVALVRGEVDYVAGDAGALNHHHISNTKADKTPMYTAMYDKHEDFSVGFATQKGNTALITKINTGLANIRANGKYDEIYKKWFGDDKSLQVPPEKL